MALSSKMKIKVSDYLIEVLKKCGVKTYFGVQGGAIAHVIESSAKKCNYIPVLNEQAGGMCAHGYYFSKEKPACVLTTTGPGFLNSVTGMAACFYDNVPSVFITGQVSKNLNLAKKFKVKMYGFQEVQHIDIGKNISDTVFKINSEDSLFKFFEYIRIHNFKITETIFIEIQDAFSRSFIKYKKLNRKNVIKYQNKKKLKHNLEKYLNNCAKPILIIGSGFSEFKSKKIINKFSNKFKIPICFSWGGSRYMSKKNLFNVGYFGQHNPGIANKLLQECDLIIGLGVSLLQHQVGKIKSKFCPKAKIIYVNDKYSNHKKAFYDFKSRLISVNTDSGSFLKKFEKIKLRNKFKNNINFKPIFKKNTSLPVNILVNIFREFDKLKGSTNNLIFSDAGASLSWTFQAANILKRPNVFTSYNIHTMGYSIPAGIGAALNKNKKVLAIIGDGGLLMNSQELVNFVRVKKNLKLIVMDNKGYGIIRQTQDDFFKSNYIGTKIGLKNNIPYYSTEKILSSFGLKIKKANQSINVHTIKKFFNSDINCLILNIDPKYKVENIKLQKNQVLPF